MVGFQGRKSPNFQGVKHFQGRNGCSFQGGFFWVPTDVRHLWIDDDFPNFPIWWDIFLEGNWISRTGTCNRFDFLDIFEVYKLFLFPSRSDPITHLGDYMRRLFLSTYVFPSLRLFVIWPVIFMMKPAIRFSGVVLKLPNTTSFCFAVHFCPHIILSCWVGVEKWI